MTVTRQCTLIVLDSVGIGELPDAADFGDVGGDTLGHIAAFRQAAGRPLHIPNLQRLGIANVTRDAGPLAGVPPVDAPAAAFARLIEVAHGKDTATGHWEFMGLVSETAFSTFPDGFPSSLIEAFCHAIGQPAVLGNVAASGTAIIEELGAEHVRTGYPIVYTSADPVFQIAAHEDVVPFETLYAWCEAAYALCIPAGMSRVIARPFEGEPGAYTRTHRRKDYALSPPTPTYLDDIAKAGVKTLGVGKIGSIYSQQGIAGDVHTKNNADGVAQTLAAMA
ncbi:MAG: phosphopentomutase, partial [Bradymonadia bacterium]